MNTINNDSIKNMEKYNVLKDKKIIGTIILIASFLMMIFGMLKIPFISSIPRYSFGMFFGWYSSAAYVFFAWFALKMIFPDKVFIPKWLKINYGTYWIVIIASMLITESWGWASFNSKIAPWNLIGGNAWRNGFTDWFQHFSRYQSFTWVPANYWGGVLGKAVWSLFTMCISQTGSGILGIAAFAISISLMLTGSFTGLYKNITSKNKLESKEAKNNDITDFTNKRNTTTIELANAKEDKSNVVTPFEDPFAELEDEQKVRNTEILEITKEAETKKIQEESASNQNKLDALFKKYSINAYVSKAIVGPTLTKFIINSGPNINYKKFAQLELSISKLLGVQSIRIESPILGTSSIGIEVPNKIKREVRFQEIFEVLDVNYREEPLPVALGKTSSGKPFIIPINKTPHMLLVGDQGTGKRQTINSILISLIARKSPRDVRFVLIDTNKIEFMPYNKIPHLLTPVITDPLKGVQALDGVVDEMERRYWEMAQLGIRTIEDFNNLKRDNKWPYLVIIINELSDLMKVSSKMTEISVQRITEKARASGIHLIISTNKITSDVLTNIIKTNIPSKIAFKVSSSIDSKAIIGKSGAEKLIGDGDLLMSIYGNRTERCQASLITDETIKIEINNVKNLQKPEGIDIFKKINTFN